MLKYVAVSSSHGDRRSSKLFTKRIGGQCLTIIHTMVHHTAMLFPFFGPLNTAARISV